MANESLGTRLKHAWNAFLNGNRTTDFRNYGPSYSTNPDRVRLTRGAEKTIVTSVYNRIAMDVASLKVAHVKLDDNGRYLSTCDDSLNDCLTLQANKDQTSRAFIQDVVLSMLDEGCVAIVPIDTDDNPEMVDWFGIETMRVGKIIEWYPDHVRVRVYDDRSGDKKEIVRHKSSVAIIENPLYAVMNEKNSTMQRLIRKLSLLDNIDEQSGAGKLDLIIQLPYAIKTEARRAQAEQRRKDIEMQLAGSKYGIAYTDGTEKVTQLNRSLENNLMQQVEYLTSTLYSQLGINEEILNGTANAETMLNYNNRTVEPIISAIVDEMKRKFLSKTARSRKHSIVFFTEPFKLVPVTQIADMADKLTRNEILTSNEFRQIIGFMPSSDPDADILRNKNLNKSKLEEEAQVGKPENTVKTVTGETT